jgi:hypothetical protein
VNISSSVRMKLGPVEFECTASEEFLKLELPVLVAGLAQTYRENFADLKIPDAVLPLNGNGIKMHPPANTATLTTNSIAGKLKVKTGAELLQAAAMRLAQMEKPTFTRTELIERMREASSYFRQTYINNLSKYIGTLVATGKLLESAKDTYALSDSAKTELEAKLAQP